MELRHLRAFVAIVEAGGVARAAARLNVSQPALSRQVLALEVDLGLRLFDRIGRRLRLTAPGEDLLLLSRRLLTDAQSLGERARAASICGTRARSIPTVRPRSTTAAKPSVR